MTFNFEKIAEIINLVEQKYAEVSDQGMTKKQEAIELINAFVDIPIVPEFIEAKVIGYVIDGMVYVFNTYIWKKKAAAPVEEIPAAE